MEAVELLIEYQSDITKETKHGWTPVLLAKKNRNHDIIDFLKDQEMDVRTKKVTRKRNNKNMKVTTIHHAAANGYLDLVKSLIESNKATIDEFDELNQTALPEAAHNDHDDLVKYLVEAGADVNIHTHGGWSPILFTVNRHVKAEIKDKKR